MTPSVSLLFEVEDLSQVRRAFSRTTHISPALSRDTSHAHLGAQ